MDIKLVFIPFTAAQHELRKRIFRRLKEEGIELPFAQRVVYFREGKDHKK